MELTCSSPAWREISSSTYNTIDHSAICSGAIGSQHFDSNQIRTFGDAIRVGAGCASDVSSMSIIVIVAAVNKVWAEGCSPPEVWVCCINTGVTGFLDR